MLVESIPAPPSPPISVLKEARRAGWDGQRPPVFPANSPRAKPNIEITGLGGWEGRRWCSAGRRHFFGVRSRVTYSSSSAWESLGVDFTTQCAFASIILATAVHERVSMMTQSCSALSRQAFRQLHSRVSRTCECFDDILVTQ